MQPIVSPMFIYIVSVVNSVSNLLFIIFLFVAVFYGGISLMILCDGQVVSKRIKMGLLIGGICGLINIFIPTKETLIAMYSAKYVTIENVKLGKEVVIDTIKEIVDVVNKEEVIVSGKEN